MFSYNASLQYPPDLQNDEFIQGRGSLNYIQQSQVSINSESDMDLEAFKQEPLKPKLRKMISNSNFCNKNEDANMYTMENYNDNEESPLKSDGDIHRVHKRAFYQPFRIIDCEFPEEESEHNQPIVLNIQQLDQRMEQDLKFSEEQAQLLLKQKQDEPEQVIPEKIPSQLTNKQEEPEFVPPGKKPNIVTRTQQKKKTPNKNTRKVLKKNIQYFQISSEEELFTSQISQAISSSSTTSCQCSKTHCLKLYCQCFHNNRFCGENCNCNGCFNDGKHESERNEAVEFIKSKGQRNSVNDIDIFDTSYVWGCKCKKTKCLKGYCECFIRGKKCTTHCKCEECDNRRNTVQVGIKKKIKKSQ